MNMFGKKKRYRFLIFYTYYIDDGSWGYGTSDVIICGSIYDKKLSEKELLSVIKQIKDLYGYDRIVLTGWERIR